MGKPDPIVYVSAMELIGLAPDQVLAVGDSLEHDIYGKALFSWLLTTYKAVCD